jgi:hypothetical protein
MNTQQYQYRWNYFLVGWCCLYVHVCANLPCFLSTGLCKLNSGNNIYVQQKDSNRVKEKQ